jgi:predicted transcriptional regulator
VKNQEGIERLFFELASESRLSILRELNEKNWKMNDVARKLDLTTTEAFRQLQRLNESTLAQKQPDSTYAITQYGKMVLHVSASLEFIFKHKEYFVNHDVWRLPSQFLSRIGELSKTTLNMNLIESTQKSSQLIGEAKQYMWGISPEPLPTPLDLIAKQIPKGVEYRVLSPQPPSKFPNFEHRTFSDSPVIFALTEKEAAVSFRFIDGRVDYAVFMGNDPTFLNWVKDLFLYYWEKGRRF